MPSAWFNFWKKMITLTMDEKLMINDNHFLHNYNVISNGQMNMHDI